MRVVRNFCSVIVLLLVCGIHGGVIDYLLSFEVSDFRPHRIWELDSGDFAAVFLGCRYVHISRDTGDIILERTDLGGRCEWVSGRSDGSFVTKDYSQGRLSRETRELFGGNLDDFVEGEVRRFDSTGQLVWTAPYVMHEDAYPEDIWMLSDGSVLSDDHKLVKYDPDGNVQWQEYILADGGIVEVEDLHILVSRNVDEKRVGVLKLAPDGTILWGTDLEVNCGTKNRLVPVLSSGGSYYCGCTTNHTEQFKYGFYFGYDGPTDASDYRVSKLGKNGNILWTKTVVADGSDELISLVANDDDGVSLFGFTSSGRGGDKMAPGTGPWVVKVDSSGNIEGDFSLPPSFRSYLAKTRRGFLATALGGFAEVVAGDFPVDTALLKSGDVISIKSLFNNLYLSLPTPYIPEEVDGVTARKERTVISTQWMVLNVLGEDGYISLRSVQNGLVASLKPASASSPLYMTADEPYDVENVKTSSLFRIKDLGEGSVNFLTQGFGALKDEGNPRNRIFASAVQSDENMKFTISGVHAGYPSVGSTITLRMSSVNAPLRASRDGYVNARNLIQFKGMHASLAFKVASRTGGLVQFKSMNSGTYLAVSSQTGLVSAKGKGYYKKTMFHMTITTSGFMQLTPYDESLGCLRATSDGKIMATGNLGSDECKIMFGRI
ncbi:hypothetical protein NDN08_004405 [Rhodosorus marinus]|uniref:Uncharacterized protein n=1 Tax=Rhodosorus marinus TaxID=101924 RepID=A0AAV8URS3_9RHOD|nr:hypothetical protein NDN08_004405 [Rhodosorus marinus]